MKGAELAPVSPRKAGTLVGVAMALAGIGSSAVSVSLPSVAKAWGFDAVGTAWVLGAFVVGVAVGSPVYGRFSDRFGSRLPMGVGYSLLALGCVVAASAWHPAVLYFGRVLTGAGAASVPALSGILLASRFEGAERTEALAYCGALSVASAAGVLIGGIADALVGWRLVMLLPLVIVFIAPTMVRMAPSYHVRAQTDGIGIALVSLTVVGLVVLLVGSRGGIEFAVAGATALACGLALLRFHIRRRPDGLLPLSVVTDRVFIGSAIAGMAVNASYYAGLVLIPSALVHSYGWGPIAIGLALLPAASIGVVIARGLRRLPMPISRLTPLVMCFGGLCLIGAGLTVRNGYVVASSFFGSTVCFGFAQAAMIDRISTNVAGPTGAVLGSYTLIFFAGGTIAAGLGGLLSAQFNPATAFVVLGALIISGGGLLAATWNVEPTPSPLHLP